MNTTKPTKNRMITRMEYIDHFNEGDAELMEWADVQVAPSRDGWTGWVLNEKGDTMFHGQTCLTFLEAASEAYNWYCAELQERQEATRANGTLR